jgi:KDO2-lipid IV(A) lauroyltransferase
MPLSFTYVVLSVLRLVPYRKKVILENIKNSFPNNTPQENSEIIKQFYKYFSRLLAESIYNLNVSKNNLAKRMVVNNPEIMDELYAKNRNVILVSAHYNNWEFLVTAQNFLFKHQAIGIGMPMTNKFWDKKINSQRERFGMHVVHAKNYKDKLKEYAKTPTATLVLGDQNPSKPYNSFWTTFLNQNTPFTFGAEIMANQTDSAVVYVNIKHVKNGYYELELDLISEIPSIESYGTITEKYVNILQKNIRNNPQFWLWSHKRWKMDIPENLEELKSEHKQRFNEKFRVESLD